MASTSEPQKEGSPQPSCTCPSPQAAPPSQTGSQGGRDLVAGPGGESALTSPSTVSPSTPHPRQGFLPPRGRGTCLELVIPVAPVCMGRCWLARDHGHVGAQGSPRAGGLLGGGRGGQDAKSSPQPCSERPRETPWHGALTAHPCSHPGEAHPDTPLPLRQSLTRLERVFKQGKLMTPSSGLGSFPMGSLLGSRHGVALPQPSLV